MEIDERGSTGGIEILWNPWLGTISWVVKYVVVRVLSLIMHDVVWCQCLST